MVVGGESPGPCHYSRDIGWCQYPVNGGGGLDLAIIAETLDGVNAWLLGGIGTEPIWAKWQDP
jgi:hypothetical protein